MRVILASQSPRRKEILSFFSLPFDQLSPHFAEELVPYQGNPAAHACELARGKAASLVLRHPKALILSADTVVACEGKLFGKPATFEENVAMLQRLSGKWHSVITAVTAQIGEKSTTEYDETAVLFHELDEEEIAHYCKAQDLLDKAGGYAIQGAGGLIVKRIEGCYYNVMGLPLRSLRTVLNSFGIDLWQKL